MTANHNSDVLRLAVPKELALECQAVLAEQGVPLNVTQSVKAMLLFAVQVKLYNNYL
jgi:hypothetical protein